MGIQTCYDIGQMRALLDELGALFDAARVVDPTETAVLKLTADGGIVRVPDSCFCAWKRESRCENCVSMRAAVTGRRQMKYELDQSKLCHVIAVPVQLTDAAGGTMDAVLEVINRVEEPAQTADGLTPPTEQPAAVWEKMYRDELTKAFNRRYLREFTFLRQSQNTLPRKLGVVMLDLRRFKKVNDTLGHLAGDQLLEQVTQILTGHVRAQDSVIRFGGDEFVVTLPNCGRDDLMRKVEELRTALSAVTEADFGCAYTDSFRADPEALQKMLEEADRRMYEEKRRNKI